MDVKFQSILKQGNKQQPIDSRAGPDLITVLNYFQNKDKAYS